MKRIITVFLMLTLLCCETTFTANATGDFKCSKISTVSVEYVPLEQLDVAANIVGVTDTGAIDALRAYSVQDLGTNGSVSVTWSIAGYKTIRSLYNYTTASGKLVLRVSGSQTASIIFYLYDSTDTKISEHTAQVSSTKVSIITFDNLFSNRQYYIKAENVSQAQTTVSGTISAS